MGRFRDRSRGVTLKVLDLSALEAQALESLRKGRANPGEPGYVESKPLAYEAGVQYGPIAIAEKKDGTLVAVCSEGVSWDVTDEEPLEIGFTARYHVLDEDGNVDEHKHEFGTVPFAETTLTPEELTSYPVVEEVDLADFIRRFGDRLENNFWENYNILT